MVSGDDRTYSTASTIHSRLKASGNAREGLRSSVSIPIQLYQCLFAIIHSDNPKRREHAFPSASLDPNSPLVKDLDSHFAFCRSSGPRPGRTQFRSLLALHLQRKHQSPFQTCISNSGSL